ncbi:Tn3 family transposase [Frankia sp. AgKG'84/4]|uniref:Tn3 family transposase n=1 Tax=Frankia sp. AgKG'84/4 TaxID=573490 RepID=UPI00200E7660|nr:Tn3 family transposase [Frankia sp. AgKG'84/4]MCL9795491.1 Tn3 family transposase [Frankia sp. AgKG'84/4]
MPVNFLTDEQRRRYGRFNQPPDEVQLGGFFHLDADARRRAMAAHGRRNQLGFAVQLGSVRFLGAFLADPTDVPAVVVDHVAAQLGLDADDLKGYGEREARWTHQAQIRGAYGYETFGASQWWALARWLYLRAWHTNERPSVLFDLATNRLVEAKVLLPGVTVIERLVAGVRERTAARQHRLLAAAPSPAQRAVLEQLVVVEAGRRVSRLDRLRRSPTDVSGAGVVKALDRYVEIDGLGAAGWDLSGVPAGRIAALARFANAARAQAVAELADTRRLATLVAFAATMRPAAADEAIEVFDLVVGDLVRTSGFRAGQARLRTLKDLDGAALVLRRAWLALGRLAADPDTDVRQVLAELDVAAVDAAAATVGQLAREPDDTFQPELLDRYATVRRFLPRLLAVVDFDAHGGQGQRMLDALEFLAALPRRRSRIALAPEDVPADLLSAAWHRRVFPADGVQAGGVDTRAYTVATVERLREALRRHEVFVPGLRKWGDPTAGLLTGEAWEKGRPQICADLGLNPEPGVDVDRWAGRLDAAYRQLADGLADNPSVRIEQRDGRDRLVLTGLDKLDEPASLAALRADVDARIPVVDLTEALLEVHRWTGCLDHFTHVGGASSRREDMTISVAAVLAAQAMNIGLAAVASDTVPALALDRLFWVEQNYLRAATLTAANAALVDYHTALPLVAAWGGGELASADGLRFVVPVRTINAGPNPKYFGRGAKGVTYYNFTSDQFTGFHGIVIPGTPRDWYYLLEGLLDQETSLRPVEIATDTAGASEMGFGIFRLLGWQFSPRLADTGSATLYRADPAAHYGPLNNLIRTRVNTAIITDSWDDLLRVAGSLLTGAVRPAELFRYLTGGGTPTPVGRALIELGRLDRSTYLAGYHDDELLRRRVNTQLNRQESRHQLCRKICHGQKGELRQRYREGQEDQLGALGFLTNACILWNTVYTTRALDQIRAEGHPVATADIARLSPLGFDHLRMLGRYNFSLPDDIRAGQLRPLRTPPSGP